MVEREDCYKPAGEEEEGCDFETDICCRWFGIQSRLVWVALEFDWPPWTRNYHEEVLQQLAAPLQSEGCYTIHAKK
jgi:hypothetical protein